MTTERSNRSRTTARSASAISPLEWRLALATALGLTYLFAWSTLGRRAEGALSSKEPGVEPARPVATTTPAPRVVWLSDLPVSDRPTIAIPSGYRLVTKDEAARVASRASAGGSADRTASLPRRRPTRIRTRSS